MFHVKHFEGRKMDANTLITLISNVGFPIAACICMGWFVAKNNENTTKQINFLNQERKTTLEENKKAIENNTKIIQQLYDYLVKRGD